MRIPAIALVGLLLLGCDYTMHLVTKLETKIDPALVGVWQRTNDGKEERLLVLPLGETEYLVSFPAGNNESLFARACLTQVGEVPVVHSAGSGPPTTWPSIAPYRWCSAASR